MKKLKQLPGEREHFREDVYGMNTAEMEMINKIRIEKGLGKMESVRIRTSDKNKQSVYGFLSNPQRSVHDFRFAT